MKAFFLLVVVFICAVSSNPSPGCSEEDEAACGTIQPQEFLGSPWPKDETELNKACSFNIEPLLNCYIEFGEKCPNTFSGIFLNSNKAHRKLYNEVCTGTHEFRAKFLRNVECLNAENNESYSECSITSEDTDAADCSIRDEVLECIRGRVEKKCGPESYDVLKELLNPFIILANAVCEIKQK